ncbi:lanthionine synthetase-like protein [Kribbella antiqua]|uniref:Lanthionine synthetase-like protein n=1 Tax=Kribbella antiqua TaxID=2512217 RepID=A0A4R2IMJ0_9ACTN|nr:lanthionine synthetase LanC family protein [Kribbella antiqua]TCO43915.1 lanthionine synthetase-like protein [Kribbella antiqua]
MTSYGELGEAAWGWVLRQVEWDDEGPWIPEAAGGDKPEEYRDGMHSGIGGLAHALAEIKLTRPWTVAEQELAAAVADRIRRSVPAQTSISYFDGLVSSIGVLTALGEPGSDAALERIAGIATDDGWPESYLEPPKYLPNAVVNDATLGTAAVLMGALWAGRQGEKAGAVAERAVELLLAEREELPTGVNWQFVPHRFRAEPGAEMPNFSHGLAGIAAMLAVAGVELDRPDLVTVARRGAEHLVTLGINDDKGFRVARIIPWEERHGDEFTYNWCHGGPGTSLLFAALDYAGVDEVAGQATMTWHRRCLDSARNSGIPERLHPGFWDNDGRCCGTAGVGDVFLDSWLRGGDKRDLEFAVRLADALVDRAFREDGSAYWRFLEHRNEDPLLPPGVGWMQGAAGIAAYLFRLQRTLDGDSTAVTRMDNWWALTGARPPRW